MEHFLIASIKRGMISRTRVVENIWLVKKLGHLSEGLIDNVNQALKLHFAIE
jgi:hypothetical protein